MKRTRIASMILTALALLVGASSTALAAPPACVQNMLNGVGYHAFSFTGRELKVSMHRFDSAWVGYGQTMTGCAPWGALGKNDATWASAEGLRFQFSDRFSGSQNFTVNSPEWANLYVNQSTGAITVNLFGGTFGPVVPTCSGNLITFTTNNMDHWAISYGPLKSVAGCH